MDNVAAFGRDHHPRSNSGPPARGGSERSAGFWQLSNPHPNASRPEAAVVRTTATPLPRLPPISHRPVARSPRICKSARYRSRAVVHLLDEGNTVPFITALTAKERTGGLNEDVIRRVPAPGRSAPPLGRAQEDDP